MKQDATSPLAGEPGVDRRARILDAAERCFVRSGFHRTTMQDVAAEAGMSPGNLYRYFPSKDAIVEGLAERDRCEMAADFAAIAHADDFMTTFRALGRKHFQDEPRGKAILCLEIWAEATRNATMGEITRTFEREVMGRLAALIEEAQGRGEIPCQVDAHGIAVIICTLGDGLFVRRAILPDFDAEEEVGRVLHLIGALLKGEASLGEANLQHERCDAEASS